ncbi:MAG: SbcC/MukB-like Walker B domain-containing protein [Vigna little leaf phytoplasma]|nr:SbcC/MukB-like Walker B domain-containing protein [Vigna little leaf phytoplasma]
MKKLTKIQLINWHLFTCQTIDIKENTLISGENGAGKSTLLDALQYILIGGKSGAKFNIAANDNAKRTLENYIKGKIGAENKEFLRNKDIITHIALEFYDEQTKKNSILGCILELPYKSLLKEKFYICHDKSLELNMFVSNNKPFNFKQFRDYMKKFNPNFEFCETKKKYQNLLGTYLKININKYIKILPKALAFKPLNLQNFVFEFLLEENPINILSLKSSVQQLKKIEEKIILEKEKLKNLQEIIDKAKEIKLLKQNIKINWLAEQMIINLEHQQQLQFIKKQQDILIREITHLLSQKKENNINIENLNNHIIQFKSSQIKDNLGLLLHSLQKDFNNYQINLNEIENKINLFQEQLAKEIILLKRIIIYFPSLKLQPYIEVLSKWREPIAIKDITEKQYIFLQKNILYISDTLSRKILEINIQQNDLNKEINILQEKINKNSIQLDSLQNVTNVYHPNLVKLKNLLTTQLQNIYNKEINIYPLCELIDIKEELWRNAIEGFLGMRKFNLIVDASYFESCLKIYEKFQYIEQIYDIGLVNIGQIPDIEENINSLSYKITTNHKDAKKYVKILLSHIICELDIVNLSKHKIAITPQGMIYSNYTAKQLNPKTYQIPYIGNKSQDMRKQLIINQIQQLKTQLESKQKDWRNNENFLFLTNQSKIFTILEKDPWDLYYQAQLHKTNMQQIENKIKTLELNPQLKQLEDSLKQFENEKEKQKIKLEKILLKIATKQNQFNLNSEKQKNLEAELQQLKTVLEQKEKSEIQYVTAAKIQLENYLKSYNHSYPQILSNLREGMEINQKQKSIKQNQLLSLMSAYIKNFHLFHLESKLESLDDFQQEYELIKIKNLVNYEQESKELRKKTENIFKEEFIQKLQESIVNAQQQIKNLNELLKNRPFGNDYYQIITKAAQDPEYSQYYPLLTKNNDVQELNLFLDQISSDKELLLEELFQKIISFKEEYELIAYEFLDYRNYLSYDIQIKDKEGHISFFSKIFREKSGGETQVPFYLIIAICFEQLLIGGDSYQKGCLVLLDEAFNNMDENRIDAMMSFFNTLKIQFLIAIPPQRIANISPYVKTNLVIMKAKNYVMVKNFTRII